MKLLIFWLPDDFADGGRITVPLSGGLVGFVALRCYAEKCAFSLSTQAQDHVWDLAEYKRVEPAHCPTGATSGGAGCERKLLWAYHPHCFIMRARLVVCMTGVLEFDLTCLRLDVEVLPRASLNQRATLALAQVAISRRKVYTRNRGTPKRERMPGHANAKRNMH